MCSRPSPQRLNELIGRMAETEQRLTEQRDKRSKTEQKKVDAEALRAQTQALLDDPANAIHAERFPQLEKLRPAALGDASTRA